MGPSRSSTSHTPIMDTVTLHHTRFLKAPSTLALNTYRDGHPQFLWICLTILIVKNIFPILNLNTYSFSSKPFLRVLSLCALIKNPLWALEGPLKSLWSLLQAEQPQLSSCLQSRGASSPNADVITVLWAGALHF